MQKPQNVKEVFLPLTARLIQFESEHYLFESDVIIYENEFHTYIEYEKLIDSIAFSVTVFDDKDVWEEAKKYEKRIKRLIKNLKPREYEHIYNFATHEVKKVKISKEKSERFLEQWKFEMHCYLKGLLNIQNASNSSLKLIDGKIEFNINQDIEIAEVHKEFKSKYSTQKCSFLLYFLKESEIIPPYNPTSLSILGKYLFLYNRKNLYDELREVLLNFSKENLLEFKNDLNILIEKIEMKIKEQTK